MRAPLLVRSGASISGSVGSSSGDPQLDAVLSELRLRLAMALWDEGEREECVDMLRKVRGQR